MIPWKVRWTSSQIFSIDVFRGTLRTLDNPGIYYKALVLSMFHSLRKSKPKKPLVFKLKQGGSFAIDDLIGCYLFWEIYIFNCYEMSHREDSKITIVDVGANIGLSTIRFKQLYPDAEIHCYEPFPGHLERLSHNIKASKLSNVKIYVQGVAAKNGKATLYVHGTNSGGHSIFPIAHPAGEFEIELIDVQHLLKNTSTGTIDILKLDCEEAEYDIIKSIDASSAPFIREIVYEATSDKYDPQELIDHLTSVGYETMDVNGTVFKAFYKG